MAINAPHFIGDAKVAPESVKLRLAQVLLVPGAVLAVVSSRRPLRP